MKEDTRCQRPFRSRRMRRIGLLALAICWLLSSCRREEVWQGAEYGPAGKLLKLSSEEPFCGCLDLVNVSNNWIHLRSNVLLSENKWRPVERGWVDLAPFGQVPGSALKARFDWAGQNAKDIYVLDAWSADGKHLNIRDVVRMNGYGFPFAPCDGMKECQVGTLFLNTGAVHQH